MTDNVININEALGIDKLRRKINSYDLSKVTFIKDGKEIKVSKKDIEDWKFTGLNNFDFIIMTDFEEKDKTYPETLDMTNFGYE